MKISLDPSCTVPQHVTAESLVLARWYDAHPVIRRLWGIRDARTLRVVVSIEPTHDGQDVYPAWLANCRAWACELRSLTGSAVEMELFGGPRFDGIEFHAGSAMVADLFWRDATLIPPHTAV